MDISISCFSSVDSTSTSSTEVDSVSTISLIISIISLSAVIVLVAVLIIVVVIFRQRTKRYPLLCCVSLLEISVTFMPLMLSMHIFMNKHTQ